MTSSLMGTMWAGPSPFPHTDEGASLIPCHDSNELVAAAVGTKSHGGVTYNTVAQNITGLMPAGSDGVNHGTSAPNGWVAECH